MWFEKEKEYIVLKATHISGQVCRFYLDNSEKKTTLSEEREALDTFIENSRAVIDDLQMTDRDLFAEFGNAKIRFNDYSSFEIYETKSKYVNKY